MSSSPKIIVLKMREIIYTIVLVFLVVLLILCLVLMFSKKQNDTNQPGQTTTTTETAQTGQTAASTETTRNSQSSTASETSQTPQSDITEQTYTPGVYTSPVTLGESTVDVEVTVDSSHINSIRLVNLSESAAASYPLVSPSLEHIASQILEKQSLDEITCPQENRYTSQLLLSAISDALTRAKQSSLTTH